jgi:hypothetical protein
MEAAQLSRPLAIAARQRKTSWVIFADGELASVNGLFAVT